MSDENLNIPAPANPEIETLPNPRPARKKRGWLIILGVLFMLIGGGMGGWFGYQQAIQERVSKANEQVAVAAATQFELAMVDLNEGRLSMAQQRLEYVLGIDPSFPGAQEKLAEVLAAIMLRLTPTVTPTPTPTPVTPTPDLRGIEAQYQSILDLMGAEDWNGAIQAIEAIRTADIAYRAVDVDGLYYFCLRNRGLRKILVEGNLEGGTYDLALASRFGPLDRDADSYRIWARMYITGASFWKVNWERVIDYFIQVAPAFPNMRDGSGMTANERLRQAYFEYGKKLILEERHCDAVKAFESSLALGNSEEVTNFYNQSFEQCSSGSEGSSESGGEPAPSETPTGTLTPTVDPTLTVTETIVPSETPSPTP